MQKHHKVAVVGSGPAAYTAAIYLARAQIKPIMFENYTGKETHPQQEDIIMDYPGFPQGIQHETLMNAMRDQSIHCGAWISSETISQIDITVRPFRLWKNGSLDTADALIFATGASPKRLCMPGGKKYCQIRIPADGAYDRYRNKVLVVVGDDDSAVNMAIKLSKYARGVHILVGRDTLRASQKTADRLLRNPKVLVYLNTVPLRCLGNGDTVTHVCIHKTQTKNRCVLEANGFFSANGSIPLTSLLYGQISLDEDGYVMTSGSTQSSVAGLFSAGTVTDRKYCQAITSAASGCRAAMDAERYLSEQDDGSTNQTLSFS